ncbi:hypothetical protein BT69DRAFT_1284843 [Atractiella rhizophila]|nr:hypothetical protein BT69DRAFT_1284843 [Atractiella rhizophila]
MLGNKKRNFLTNETEHGFLESGIEKYVKVENTRINPSSPLSLFRLTGLTIDGGVLVCHSESFRSC